jgi:hypothetical protein
LGYRASVDSQNQGRYAGKVEQEARGESRAEHGTDLEPARANPKRWAAVGPEQQYIRKTEDWQNHDQKEELAPYPTERKYNTYADPDEKQKGGPSHFLPALKTGLQKEPKADEPHDTGAD